MKKPYLWLKARFASKKINLVHPTVNDDTDSQSDSSSSARHKIDRDSDSDCCYRTLNKLTKASDLVNSGGSSCSSTKGYVSLLKSLAQAKDLNIQMPKNYELEALMDDPSKPMLFRKLDSESWDFVSDFIEARNELFQQGHPTDGTKKRQRRSQKSAMSYKLWPRSQWPNRIRK